MAERNKRLEEIADQFNENILAVKGTLELVDTSITEDDLHKLLLKAMERIDIVQRLSNEMLVALRKCIDKMGEMKE